jgi:hypothetical protein
VKSPQEHILIGKGKFFSFFPLLILLVVNCSCNGKSDVDKNVEAPKHVYAVEYTGLKGTWIRQNKSGFTLIEIEDSTHILYNQVIDRKAEIDTITQDRYWYHHSKATMGYWDSTQIWIKTSMFRFDYKLKGDTLIEFDKVGDQGIFIKVYTDEQKDSMNYNKGI